jgi:hypothetical protein
MEESAMHFTQDIQGIKGDDKGDGQITFPGGGGEGDLCQEQTSGRRRKKSVDGVAAPL